MAKARNLNYAMRVGYRRKRREIQNQVVSQRHAVICQMSLVPCNLSSRTCHLSNVTILLGINKMALPYDYKKISGERLMFFKGLIMILN